MTQSFDAIVVGGGLSGVAAASAVADAGLNALHVAPKAPPDRRTSALMEPSVAYLRQSGLVADPATIGHPLTEIRLIDATERLLRAPETLFVSAEVGVPAFGWNFPNTSLLTSFDAARSKHRNLTTIESVVADLERRGSGWLLRLADGTEVEAPLVVGADGKKSFVRMAGGFRAREHGFKEAALVADLDLGSPIGGTSVEFHYPRGPFTLVPAGGNKANLVWIDDRDLLRAAQAEGKDGLTRHLMEKSQRLFGNIELLTPAHIFLLSTLTVTEAGHNGLVLVGEAAHAFPPIGAQGLNLGLRDVRDLAAALSRADRTSADWAVRLSADYAARREADLARTGSMVDTLFKSLLTDFLPAQAVRAGGIWALKSSKMLRRQAFALGMGAN